MISVLVELVIVVGVQVFDDLGHHLRRGTREVLLSRLALSRPSCGPAL